ncbi:P-loop containing nucleoside triphosphate hydrolase protein [Naematelia encephala]|uniref:Peroxisomal ATPase PEX1 n=1 Tax=Naematelia encephala TaxID=71784 RepID=A0A1Y2AZ63_9TREE|nr:P-loop containing nucleoside triphosphate hydrolase protein [Naematelia encephala]
MPRKASVKYRSLRSNLVHLPLSLYASLAQQQARPQGIILHLSPLVSPSSSSSRPPQAAYLGWSGLAAASSLAGVGLVGSSRGEGLETVEVDPEVAMGLGWAEGTVLDISVIHNPIKAKSVSVTPLTSDDWEILEQHANYLENNLLSQLRAAQKGQLLDVWVMGRTKIRIRVDETNPASTNTSAVLVHADTEIFVAPRPRDSGSKAQVEKPQLIDSPSASTSKRTINTSKKSKEKGMKLRLVPQRVATQWGEPNLAPAQLEAAGSEKVGLCSAETLDRVKKKLGRKEKDEAVFVKLTQSLKGKEKAQADKVVASEKSKEVPEQNEEIVEVFLVSWEEMPAGCVVLTGKANADWQDWADVRIHSAAPRRGRLKSAKSNESLLTNPPPSRHLTGIDDLVADATAYLHRCNSTSIHRPLLLTGNKGSGKTSISRRIGEALEADRQLLADILYEDVTRLDPDARISTTKEQMTSWLEEASRRRPCLLILDGLDSLLLVENELTPSQHPAILADHFARTFTPSNIPSGVLVLATATSTVDLHPVLNQKHVFGETLKILVKNKEKRRAILESLIEEQESVLQTTTSLTNGNDLQSDVDLVLLSSNTEGYSPADLVDLVSGAVQQALIRTSHDEPQHVQLGNEDFALALAAFTPTSLRGVSLQKSDVQWRDIGGLREPKRVLRETLEWPTKYAQIFAASPLRLRSGILLYGYPGSGKTMLASAVAKECGLNFISVKGPEILNKYIGASEKAVRDLFERATGAKPCVLFFDEFDSIAPRRGHDSTGVTDRVVNQLLTEMDGAQGLDGVYVLAATSRPDLIDPALLRPGRLDKSILCDMPNYEDRVEILGAVSDKLNLSPSVDLGAIATATEGFSGADLQAVIYNAHLAVVHASISVSVQEEELKILAKSKGKGKGKAKENGHVQPPLAYRQVNPTEEGLSPAQKSAMSARIEAIVANSDANSKSPQSVSRHDPPKAVIEHLHLTQSLASTRPSVSLNDRARLERIYRSFVADREGGMQNGDLGRETGTRVSLM